MLFISRSCSILDNIPLDLIPIWILFHHRATEGQDFRSYSFISYSLDHIHFSSRCSVSTKVLAAIYTLETCTNVELGRKSNRVSEISPVKSHLKFQQVPYLGAVLFLLCICHVDFVCGS